MITSAIPCVNPATGEQFDSFVPISAAELDATMEAARRAAAGWRAAGPAQRRIHLLALADALEADLEAYAQLDTAETGNPIAAMRVDATKAMQYLRYFAHLAGEIGGKTYDLGAGRRAVAVREPFGVAAVITAYNHPFYYAIVKTAAALAAGNAVVLKPPEAASLSSLRLGEAVRGHLPGGVFSVAAGGPDVGRALVGHPGADRVSFTGGLPAGREVLAGAGHDLKVATAETGGKNAFVACADVAVDEAADAVVASLNLSSVAGQSCSSTSRLFVHGDVHGDLVEAVAKRFDAIDLGPPEDPSTQMGSLISVEHRDKVHAAVERAVEAGARLVCGGTLPDEEPLRHGAFYRPTCLSDVSSDMEVAVTELFGPVLSVLRWDDADELVEQVNGTGYGLTANVWSRDSLNARRLADRFRVGLVWVNAPVVAMPLGVPFGGVGLSGMARDHCLEELQSFTYIKTYGIDGPI